MFELINELVSLHLNLLTWKFGQTHGVLILREKRCVFHEQKSTLPKRISFTDRIISYGNILVEMWIVGWLHEWQALEYDTSLKSSLLI